MNIVIGKLNLLISASLVTLIWIIQILHYPSFSYYDRRTFSEAMLFHQNRISLIVVPAMIGEVMITVYLCAKETNIAHALSFVCVVFIWCSTFFIQVPLHKKLTTFDDDLIKKLVLGNYVRTILWTCKFMIVFYDHFKGYI